MDAQVATPSKTTKGRKPIQIVAEYELKIVTRSRKIGLEKWGDRCGVGLGEDEQRTEREAAEVQKQHQHQY